MTHACSHPAPTAGVHVFDARGVARRFRHAAIFGAMEALTAGETMRFYNDHDPLPLLSQLGSYFGDRVGVNYVSRRQGEIIIDFTLRS